MRLRQNAILALLNDRTELAHRNGATRTALSFDTAARRIIAIAFGGIAVRLPFDGSTVDGIQLGDDEAAVRDTYPHFAIETFLDPRQAQIEGRPVDRT